VRWSIPCEEHRLETSPSRIAAHKPQRGPFRCLQSDIFGGPLTGSPRRQEERHRKSQGAETANEHECRDDHLAYGGELWKRQENPAQDDIREIAERDQADGSRLQHEASESVQKLTHFTSYSYGAVIMRVQ
jgi:hypothetical protein